MIEFVLMKKIFPILIHMRIECKSSGEAVEKYHNINGGQNSPVQRK